VVVHPQSVVHGAVELARRRAARASLACGHAHPDRRRALPPRRAELPWQRLDLATLGRLEFFAPDTSVSLARLAYAAFARGGTAPAR